MQLADFNHIANYFSPVDSFQHILRILTAFVTTSRLLSFHRRQGGNIQQTGWMNAIQETIEDTIDSLPDDGHSAEMAHNTEARKRFITAIPDLLNAGLGIGDNPPPPLLTERASPILLTLREECAMPDCGGTLRRKKDRETAVTLITRSYTQVKARLVVAYCSGCRAVYLPDRALVKDETMGELRQFYKYNACFLRISKPEMLWVERTVAVAQAQAILQHQTFSSYAAYFNRTYGPYGAASATDGLDAEYLHPTITNDQSFQMNGQENQAGGSRFGVAGVDSTAPHLPTVQSDAQDVGTIASSDNKDDSTDDEEVLPNEEPQLEGPDRVVQMAVMDGIVTGHLICNAPVDPPCQNPPADFKTARFCKNHSTYNFQCSIKGCFCPIVPKLKVCNSAAHLEYYEQYQKRFARTLVYAVRRTMEHRAEAQQQVAQSIDVDLSSIPAPLALPSLPNNSSDQPTQHTFQAARTYCVQILTWSCGHPVAATKLYVSESESQVYNWITKVFPDTEEGRLFRPDYLAYDQACSLLRHIVTSHQGSSWIQSTRFIVDAWHYICHRVNDIVCRKRCNTAPSDGSQLDLIIEEPDETGWTVKRRAFNTETAEQLDTWFGGYKATLNRMTDYNFDFMVFSVLFLHAADWRYRRDEQDRMRERQEARRARADAEPAEENEGDGEESGPKENGELQHTENNMDIDMS